MPKSCISDHNRAMKCIIIFVTLAIAATHAVTDEQKEFLVTTRSKCEQESGLASDQAAKIRQGQFNDDPKVKEYMVCFFKRFEVIDDSGNFKIDQNDSKFLSLVGSENAEKIKNECMNKKATIQETAFEFGKCSFKYRPKDIYSN